jgi:hypothetical protein
VRRLPKLRGGSRIVDEPPVMWSPPGSGFEASPLSPAGEMQGFWRLTGRGRHAHEKDAPSGGRASSVGRSGSIVLRVLGWRGRRNRGGDGDAAARD